ncbi:MAG TPA: tRNA uridine-5-carboxymethylaminomethyl(34) synthesis GTPase MnmE [Sphingomonas sp.]
MTATVFAVSSGRPPAAIAIIRVSGPRAFEAVRKLAGTPPPTRQAGLRALRDGAGHLLDRALVLTFPAPHTATGEDLVEFHCHGGRAVVAAVEGALATIDGLRPALPGEFTRRAVMNGRIDLAAAEGLADLLAAETEAQRVAAMDAAEGRVSAVIHGWLDRLAMLAARIEATLDFADESDVADDQAVVADVVAGMCNLAGEIDALLTAPSVERLRDGIRVVIAGPPNAGKSTLINLLGGREAAIVSPIAGTTRDRIEVPVVRQGIAYLLTDTAGLTHTDDPIEAIGVDRARRALATADLVLWLGDEAAPEGALAIHARADLPGRELCPPGRVLAVSASRPDTIDALWSLIAARTASLLQTRDLPALHEHQRACCNDAARALRDATVNDSLILAEQLRVAHARLGAILGIDATEAMLDALFGRFCIGK